MNVHVAAILDDHALSLTQIKWKTDRFCSRAS